MTVTAYESTADKPLSRGPRITVVIPVLNAIRFLPQSIPAVLEAVSNTPGVEVVCVDNGSIDGSFEYLATFADRGIQLRQKDGLSIAALRNYGARLGRGAFFSFLDADCSIIPQYFNHALEVLQATGAAATGCQVQHPREPHWIEAAWDAIHYLARDQEVDYLNSGNFFISRQAFEHVGGFREDLRTGEDAELGYRLTRAGYRIRAATTVAAVHLGNPKSIPGFYRRNVWHGLGMFGTVNRSRIDKPTAMTFLHLLASVTGLLVMTVGPLDRLAAGAIAFLFQLAVPCITVAYRARRAGRASHVGQGIFLYWLYYWARLHALVLILTGKSATYAR